MRALGTIVVWAVLAALTVPAFAEPARFAPTIAMPFDGGADTVAIGDIDGDGINDVVVGGTKITVLFGAPGGGFAEPKLIDAYGGQSLVLGDFNGDGRLDIATTESGGEALPWFAAGPGRTFTTMPGVSNAPPYVLLATADVDGDGRTDVVATPWSTSAVYVHYQQPGGGFGAGVPVTANLNGWNDLKVADVSGDGRPDILFVSVQNAGPERLGVAVQRSDGTFDPPTYIPHPFQAFSPWSIAAIRVNADAVYDLVTTQSGSTPGTQLLVVYGGALNQTQDLAGGDTPDAMRAGDIDGDGLEDLVTLYDGTVGVHARLPGGGFAPEVTKAIGYYASLYKRQGFALGDLDGDGRIDVAIADYNHGLLLLYNLTGACGEFADVGSTSAFCSNVRWLRNRNVTLGCSDRRYCPGDAVTRLAMAAFLNRMSGALTPDFRHASQEFTSTHVGGMATPLCATQPFAAATHPRRFRLDAVLAASAASDVDVIVSAVTTNNNVFWVPAGSATVRATASAGRWTNTRLAVDVSVPESPATRFGLAVRPAQGGVAELAFVSCRLRAIADHHDDAEPVQ